MTKSYVYLIDFITKYWDGDIIINPKAEQKNNIDYLEEKTQKEIKVILSEFLRGKNKFDIYCIFCDNCVKDRKFILQWFLIYLESEYDII